jgi:hypothetical protein
MAIGIKWSSCFDHLVSHFPGDLENDVKKEEGNVSVEAGV